MGVAEGTGETLAAKFGAIFPHLDERQRRLLMGAEARALGHGGIRVVALAAGVREATVSLGVGELDSGAAPLGRARRHGGGRKRLADLDPGLRPALLALVEPDERGDPMSPLRWTTKSLRALAAELTRQGHRAGADTVADLLHEEGFSLQGNAKALEGKQSPDRDAQFRYLNEQVRDRRDAGEPVISVDTRKKELIGNYRNGGREWRPAGDPVRVRDHDFPDPEPGKAIPYGICDLAADAGWVNVGTGHDTAQFAVESIRRWWNDAGLAAYPRARRLLITADSGGPDSNRTRAWKTELAALARETGLEITACHFPPGTSKWNKIEHRLFSHITMNWRGRPLTSHEVLVQAIASTTTRTGLRVRAELDTATCPPGAQISDEQMAALPIRRHDWHGDWNYTLPPAPSAPAPAPAPATRPGRGDRPGWARPALTGMTGSDWDRLTAALAIPYQAQCEADRHIARGGPATRRRGGGHPRAMTLAEKTLATIMRQRPGVPRPVLAELSGVSPNTIGTAERQVKPLLARAGHITTPATTPLTTLADLTAYATSQGLTLMPKTKPAR
jgi:Rhodopirellula transposase DDE domain